MSLCVAVLGLGEAGGRIAADLGDAGCSVRGWDPARPTDVRSDEEAVRGADLVLSLTTAACALDAARSAAPALTPGQIYADLNTASPAMKRELGELVAAAGAAFADVALLGPVPARGLSTPALASGPGAERLASLVRPLGMPVEVVGHEPGTAAGLKLLRSVFMKGLAASVVESLEAAKACGADAWLRAEIVDVLNEPLVERLVSGTTTHAERRLHEMRDAAAYLDELGIEPRVATAAAGWLEELTLEGSRA